jgi:hypothetical protein
LAGRTDALGKSLPADSQAAFFELTGYPVKAAAAMNEQCLTGSPAAMAEIQRLTDFYNTQLAGGKWRNMMSDDPRGQLASARRLAHSGGTLAGAPEVVSTQFPGGGFGEENHRVIMAAAHASAFVPGADARWQTITGLGYNGEAATIFPATTAVRSVPEKILAESPCLQFMIQFKTAGNWTFTVRALPTFSVETGKPQRYAIALDDEAPQIISLPAAMSESDRWWQEDVLRNAVLTTSHHQVAAPGWHTLKIWMVDPGIVLDTIGAGIGDQPAWGYVWPAETGGGKLN